MSNLPRVPLVRPPRLAQGGGVAAQFGNSGAPGIPLPGASSDLQAVLAASDARGRFNERVFVFPPFDPIDAQADKSQTIEVTSNRSGLMRLVALRAVITSASSPTAYDLANLKLLLSINGTEDFTTSGQRVNPVSFAILFANTAAPWWWYSSPPLIKAGDMIQCTVFNTGPGGEGSNTMVPEVALRVVDDMWWRALYGGG